MDKFSIKDVNASQVEEVFEQHKQQILNAFVGKVVDVQHVGATSVEGLLSKGDLDIQVRVAAKDFEAAKAMLRDTYEVAQEENWNQSFASFKDDSGEVSVGVQLTVIDSEDDDYFYKLRDILNKDAESREAFNQLKRNYNGVSMDEYRRAKSKFIEELLRKS